MTIVINNDVQHQFEATECYYDYFTKEWSIKTIDEILWSDDVLIYLQSLQNTTITSIQVKNQDETVRSYNNFSGTVSSLKELFQYSEDGPLIIFELSIRRNS